MCEDSVEKLSMDNVRKPLDVIIPKLIALFTCPDEMVRMSHQLSQYRTYVPYLAIIVTSYWIGRSKYLIVPSC